MRTPLTLLTAAAVLLHVLWGCCGHHGACATTSTFAGKPIEIAHPMPRTCCGGHGKSCETEKSAPGTTESPPRSRGCDQQECSFLAATDKAECCTFAWVTPIADVLPRIAGVGVELPSSFPPAALPCRRHLWCGVLLI